MVDFAKILDINSFVYSTSVGNCNMLAEMLADPSKSSFTYETSLSAFYQIKDSLILCGFLVEHTMLLPSVNAGVLVTLSW